MSIIGELQAVKLLRSATSGQVEQTGFKVYGYRWVVLLVYFLLNAMLQVQWITFAPITSEAVAFYNVSAVQIDLLFLIFMIVYILPVFRHLTSSIPRASGAASALARCFWLALVFSKDFATQVTRWLSWRKSVLPTGNRSF